MHNRMITDADARVVVRILDDAIFRLEALGDRGNYEIRQLLTSAMAYLGVSVMERGACRTEMLAKLTESLQGKCPCEAETKGSA